MSSFPELRARPGGRNRAPTWGEAALAALLLAIASGVPLAIPFELRDPWGSVAGMLLANPWAAWFRNLHFWSAQAFLVLTGLHAFDTVRRRQELRLREGPWLRVALSTPALGLLMLTGFLLRGDPDAQQALRLLANPLMPSLELAYVHHAATLTVLVLLVAVEHGRVLTPRGFPLVAGAVALVSLFLSPGLHEGLDPVVKGPWYFVGLQELLHHAPQPLWLVPLAALPLALLAGLRWMPDRPASRTRRALLALLLLYAGLGLVGWFFRGEDWRWAPNPGPRTLQPGWVFRGLEVPAGELRRNPVPVVLGRPEGCLFCHRGTRGLSRAHDPQAVGCASCHRGQPFSLDAGVAHQGMTRTPGDLEDAARTCGTAECHPSVVPRVRTSLMNTMAGVVAVDRAFFGEPPVPAPVQSLGTRGADGHLRQLCASCHVGAPKPGPGPVTEESRGGGCSACHLVYSPEARRALVRPPGQLPRPEHPDLSLQGEALSCFGCHSRSGRISLGYEGWHEGGPAGPSRTLADGRIVFRGPADVHAERGMRCTDCHTALEVMGDGAPHTRKSQALRVACEDCHAAEVRTAAPEALGEESRRIRALRPGPAPARPVLLTARGDALLNTFLDAGGRPRLFRKADGRVLALRPPSPACRDGAHDRLSCASCHTPWTARCATCHTSYRPEAEGYDLLADRPVRGEWVERGQDGKAAPPTLGVRGGTVIEPFAPGMVATLEKPGEPPAFRRLYALAFPHTVSPKGRSCRSCHNEPTALGYGEGRLAFEGGRWTYTPDHPPARDGLPADAWTGFLAVREGPVSTREDCRPFDLAEQRRILTVGACLTCHGDESPVMRAALRDFQATRSRLTPACALPRW